MQPNRNVKVPPFDLVTEGIGGDGFRQASLWIALVFAGASGFVSALAITGRLPMLALSAAILGASACYYGMRIRRLIR